MKKFMTVLLVVAVMFTFSFGSAFAAPATSSETTLLNAAESYALTTISTNFETAFKEVTEGATVELSDSHWEVKKATVVEQKDAIWAAIQAAVKSLTAAEAAATTLAYDTTAYDEPSEVAAALYADFDSVAKIKDIIVDDSAATSCGTIIAKAQYEKDYAAEVEKFGLINKDVYAAKYATRIDAYAAKVKKDMAAAKASVKGLAGADILAAETSFTDFAADLLVAEVYPAGSTYETGLYLLTSTGSVNGIDAEATFADKASDPIKTQEQVDAEEASVVADAAAVKAEAQKQYADYIKADGTDKTFASAYTTIYNYLADNKIMTDPSDVDLYSAVNKTNFKNAVKQAEALKAFAEKYKAELAADGSQKRIADAVDKLVKATIDYEYATVEGIGGVAKPFTSYSAAWEDTKDEIEAMSAAETAADLEYAKKVSIAALEAAKAEAADAYYPAEYATVAAKYDEAIAKVNAVTKEDDIATAEAVTITELDKDHVFTTSTADSYLQFASTATVEGALKQAVIDYCDYANTGKSSLDATYINCIGADIEAIITDIYGESEARNQAAYKALGIDAATVAAKLTTVGGLKAQQDAVKAAIEAIPATVTVAAKDAVKAAYDLDAEYKASSGYTYFKAEDTLDAAIDSLYDDMKKDFVIRSAKVDKTDKAALKALQEEIAAANEKAVDTDADGIVDTFDGGMFNLKDAFSSQAVDTALTTIKGNEQAAVEAAINAIPLNVTEADRATVEAARALYDAYVAEYTDPAANEDARTDFSRADIATLTAAETLLGISVPSGADTFDDTAAKAYVQDLTIVARSTKLSSGKVKVTVKADVEELINNGYTVKYKFFASTAKKSGYKSKIEKTTKSFTTSGVKGKTNYWKVTVKVYNAAGELVAKTPLTQCKYACRTL